MVRGPQSCWPFPENVPIRPAVAFGITALLASTTVPLIEPVEFWPTSDKLLRRNPNKIHAAEKAREVVRTGKVSTDLNMGPFQRGTVRNGLTCPAASTIQ